MALHNALLYDITFNWPDNFAYRRHLLINLSALPIEYFERIVTI